MTVGHIQTFRQNIVSILASMRADSIPEGTSGLWRVAREFVGAMTQAVLLGRGEFVPPQGMYTFLLKDTMADIHRGGAVVMNDFGIELRKHLRFVLRAHGSVLITGLGLGCVLRGVLWMNSVKRVVVVERDENVLALVQPHLPSDPRLEIVQADACEYATNLREPFDCAWHDLWSDPDRDERHLDITHSELILALAKKVPLQGAWEMPRWMRRSFNKAGLEVV